MSIKNLILVIEETNFNVFLIFYRIVLYSFISIVGLLIFFPSLMAFSGSIAVLSKADVIFKSLFNITNIKIIKDNAGILMSLTGITFIFLTNCSAAFSRIPNIGEDEKNFRDAAYGFLLCTILVFLSIGIYVILINSSIISSQVVKQNLVNLFFGILSLISVTFGFSLFQITLPFAGKFFEYMSERKIEKTALSIIEGNDIYTFAICLMFWITIWFSAGMFISRTISGIVSLNIIQVLLGLAITIFYVRRWMAFEASNRTLRLINVFCLIALFTVLKFDMF